MNGKQERICWCKADETCNKCDPPETNTTSASQEVAGAKEAGRSTPPYTADNGDSKGVAAVGRSCAPRETQCHVNGKHEGFYYCKHCGLDLTPDIAEQHGRYNDSPGAARSIR